MQSIIDAVGPAHTFFCHMQYPGGIDRQEIFPLLNTGTQNIMLTKQCPFR